MRIWGSEDPQASDTGFPERLRSAQGPFRNLNQPGFLSSGFTSAFFSSDSFFSIFALRIRSSV